jgi:group I intron endonuclease
MIGIYKITSKSKRVYIGQSIDIEKRFKSYKYKIPFDQPRLRNSFLKYGFDNHKFEILCECEVSELNDKERYYQDLYNATSKNGLNCSLTTSSDRNGKASQETRLKMSITRTGMKQSKETCLKKSNRMKGKNNPMFGRNGDKNSFYGKTHSKETLDKISRIHLNNQYCKGRKVSNETKKKMSFSSLGNTRCKDRILSEITKNKISNSLKRKVINVETGEIYTSATELAEMLNISKWTIQKRLNGQMKNNTNFKYL